MRWTNKLFIGLLVPVLMAASIVGLILRPKPEVSQKKIDIDGQTRSIRIVVPPSADGGERLPVVIAFHGMGDSEQAMPRYTRLDQHATAENFLVVYPRSLGNMWRTVGPDADSEENPDVKLFDALMEYLIANYPIDCRRVYLVGMSNGGTMVHLLASRRSDQIAAVAAYAGTLPESVDSSIDLPHKYPVLLLCGSEDSIANVDASRRARWTYELAGHHVELEEAPGIGHNWDRYATSRIWTFVSGFQLDAAGAGNASVAP